MEFVPCAPIYVVSIHRQHPVIQYKSKRWDDTVLEFRYKSAGPKNSNILFYQCIACKNVANQSRLGGEKSGVAHIKLVNGVIVTDPDNPNTPHNCGAGNNTTTTAEVLAKRYMLEERTKIRESRKRPPAAFDEAIDGVEEHYKAEYGQAVVDDIKVKLNSGYGFSSKRRALTENRSFHIVKNNTLDNIHESLRVTKDNEPFLQTYDLSLGRKMLIFFAISDLDMLLEAEFVLCDGNQKYNPPEFHKPRQLYTLHTIIKGECHPFLFAMMKKVDQDAYRHLFNSLRQAMVTRFGHLGNLPHCTWLFDFEPAAMGACIDVFNPLKVQEHLRLLFAQDLLRAVPIYTSPMTNAQMQEFCKYFTGYWLSMPLIRDVWGQFGNSGPRTTNYVEGWHNGLHSRMNGRHPSLAKLIGLFQISQNTTKFRVRALRTDPLALPKPQKAEVICRNILLHNQMNMLYQYFMSSEQTSFQDIMNYLDRITAIGVLSQQL
uniref:MULE transposase domain-containing protein n=1 Tax=Plectus sambesii TaxID=2011161 RepID=A0A914UQ12_9BILA